MVFLSCSTAAAKASFIFPHHKLPALTEKIQAALTNGDDNGEIGNGGGGNEPGKFLQLWRDNANITYDHDDDGIIYLYSNLIEKMIRNSKTFDFSAKLTLLVPKDDAFSKVAIEAGLPDLFLMADPQLAWQVVANHIIDYKPFSGITQQIPRKIQVTSLGFTQLNFTGGMNHGEFPFPQQ